MPGQAPLVTDAGVCALILAGGLSSRMAPRFKPLLPLGGLTPLARLAATFRAAGITDITVVVGHRAEEAAAAAARLGLFTVYNPRFKTGMYSSIKAGLAVLPPGTKRFFLTPVDVPLFRPATVRRLLERSACPDAAPAIFPTFQGERGHPPLLSTEIVPVAMVEPDPDRLRAQGLDAVDILTALGEQNKGETIGEAFQSGQAVAIRLDNFFRTPKELSRAVVAVKSGRPVYLADVAKVTDGFDEPGDYVFFVPGKGLASQNAQSGQAYPAVTLSVAKRAGENASRLAAEALARIKALRGYILPADCHMTVTRDYGESARHKVNELLKHLVLAAVTVGGVVALFLGLRASLVVMTAPGALIRINIAGKDASGGRGHALIFISSSKRFWHVALRKILLSKVWRHL